MTALTSNKDPMADFKERLTDKLKNDIGALIPEEAIQALIARAVEEQFFKPRYEKPRYGGPIEKPSWFVEQVAQAAKPMIQAQVDKFVADNQDTLEQAVRDFLSAQNLTLLATASMAQHLQASLMQQTGLIMNKVTQNLSR